MSMFLKKGFLDESGATCIDNIWSLPSEGGRPPLSIPKLTDAAARWALLILPSKADTSGWKLSTI